MENVTIMKRTTTEEGGVDLSISNSVSGLPIIKQSGYYLNSKYNPIKESKQLAERFYKKNYTHVLFGLAYAYLAKEFLYKMGETDFLLIVEPSEKLFHLLESNEVLTSLLNHRQVFFIVGYESDQIEEEIRYLVNTRNIGQIEFITSPNYDKLYPHLLKHLKEVLIRNVRLSLVNIATMVKYGKPWQENLLNNLCNSWKSVPFKKFEKKFKCPVVIAASGPSLNKQLENLKKIKDRGSALIIAAGSTINPLLKAGIKPHIVVSIDGDVANWRHFEDLEYDDVPLFYSLNVHKNIPKYHKGLNVIFNSQDKELSNWINENIGMDIGFVVGGASVANYCFYIAKYISTGPICFIGQDLSYTDNLSHAVGNRNLKMISRNEIGRNKNYVEIKGYYGGTVLSDFSFISMKKVFEDMISNFRKYGDNRLIYNCTEGGAYIEGIENLRFKEFINNYCSKSYTKEINSSFEIIENNLIPKANVLSGIEKEMKNLNELKKVVKRAINIIKDTSMEAEFIDNKTLNILNSLDDRINSYSSSNIIYYLIMPLSFKVNHLYQEAENESPMERKKRIVQKSLALYKGILESVEYSLEILNKINNEQEKGI